MRGQRFILVSVTKAMRSFAASSCGTRTGRSTRLRSTCAAVVKWSASSSISVCAGANGSRDDGRDRPEREEGCGEGERRKRGASTCCTPSFVRSGS